MRSLTRLLAGLTLLVASSSSATVLNVTWDPVRLSPITAQPVEQYRLYECRGQCPSANPADPNWVRIVNDSSLRANYACDTSAANGGCWAVVTRPTPTAGSSVFSYFMVAVTHDGALAGFSNVVAVDLLQTSGNLAPGGPGSFAVRIGIVPPAGCLVRAVLPPGFTSMTGTTSGTNRFAGTCAAQSGQAPEDVIQWTAPKAGTVTVSTCSTETGFDSVVYVRRGTCTGSEIACNDDLAGCAVGDPCANRDHHGSKLTFAALAGETYFIVVDGFSGSCGGSSGAYRLTVTQP